MTQRRRADQLLVERGLFASRTQAQAAITAGLVTADAVVVSKPSAEISVDAAIEATPAHPWVSRGGVKLAAALDQSQISVTGKVCLDVGASTGGFSQVLLARGARLVYAVDVGNGQLHERLRAEARLISFEEADIRSIDAAHFLEPPTVVTIDVSFISLKLVLAPAIVLAAERVALLALIKPQFEAPRSRIKKGIVRDSAVHVAVCEDIAAYASSLDLVVDAIFPSAITGGDGNREFFLAAHG